MDSMSEQWWEKKLNIRTAGKVDHFIEEACNPYEPTDKPVTLMNLQTTAFWKPLRTADTYLLTAMFSITGAGKGAQRSFSVSGQAAARQESNLIRNSVKKQ